MNKMAFLCEALDLDIAENAEVVLLDYLMFKFLIFAGVYIFFFPPPLKIIISPEVLYVCAEHKILI